MEKMARGFQCVSISCHFSWSTKFRSTNYKPSLNKQANERLQAEARMYFQNIYAFAYMNLNTSFQPKYICDRHVCIFYLRICIYGSLYAFTRLTLTEKQCRRMCRKLFSLLHPLYCVCDVIILLDHSPTC